MVSDIHRKHALRRLEAALGSRQLMSVRLVPAFYGETAERIHIDLQYGCAQRWEVPEQGDSAAGRTQESIVPVTRTFKVEENFISVISFALDTPFQAILSAFVDCCHLVPFRHST